MKEVNHAVKYNTVIQKFWPTNLELTANLEHGYASITGTMIDTKNPLHRLEQDPVEYGKKAEKNYLHDLKCVTFFLDVDSFWKFQKTSTQRIMISLPAQTYIRFCQNKAHCFCILKDRVTDYNKIFDFQCIDFAIHGNDHFSQVFFSECNNGTSDKQRIIRE